MLELGAGFNPEFTGRENVFLNGEILGMSRRDMERVFPEIERFAEIGAFITQVVEKWDTETLVNRIKLQVGRDLQYIRINGTLVGGLVGLIIFTVTRLL